MQDIHWERDFGGENLIHFFRLINDTVMIQMGGSTYPASEINGYDEQITPTDLTQWVMPECPYVCWIDIDTFNHEVVNRRNQVHVFKWNDHVYVFPTAFFVDLGIFIGKRFPKPQSNR